MNNPTFLHLKNNHTSIKYFGLGFIQVDYTPYVRYNLYSKDFKKTAGKEELHTHRYNFYSSILVGKLTQWIYNEYPPGFGGRDINYQLMAVNCKKSEPVFYGSATLELALRAEFAEGSSYWINKNTFHKVESDFCITRIDRPDEDDKEEMALVATKAGNLTCPFSVPMSEDELWANVENMWANI